MDKDVICDFENLYRAYKKAKAGKGFNGSSAKFQIMNLEGLHILKEQLENQTYRMNPYNEFKVYEPKERVIKSCSFKDKVCCKKSSLTFTLSPILNLLMFEYLLNI